MTIRCSVMLSAFSELKCEKHICFFGDLSGNVTIEQIVYKCDSGPLSRTSAMSHPGGIRSIFPIVKFDFRGKPNEFMEINSLPVISHSAAVTTVSLFCRVADETSLQESLSKTLPLIGLMIDQYHHRPAFLLVSLENIQTDVQDLTRGLDNAKKELVIRQTLKVIDRRLAIITGYLLLSFFRMRKLVRWKNFSALLRIKSIVWSKMLN
jgi:hypothetical protein